MVSKILFWSGFGIAVRLWQLGIEMRPFFHPKSLWVYPIFAGAGASFGYWLTGVQARQDAILHERKQNLLAKRRRRAEREGKSIEASIADGGVHEKPVEGGGFTGAGRQI